MSLDARFTQLRHTVSRGRNAGATYHRNSPRETVSSLKNRLLAMEMAERPNVMAALSRGRPRMRGGPGGGIGNLRRSRSPFPRGRPKSGQRNVPMRRANSLSRLDSHSLQSLMSIGLGEAFVMGRRGGGGGRGGGGRGAFRTRIFSRGSRITARGGIKKLNMDIVGAANRRLGTLNRFGNNVVGGGGGFKRGRGARAASAGGVKSRLGVRSGSLNRSPALSNLTTRRGGGRGAGAVRQRANRRGGGTVRGGRGGISARQSPGGARGRGRGRAGQRGSARGRQTSATRGGAKGQRQGGRGGAANKRGGGGTGRRAAAGRRGRGGRGGVKKETAPTKEELDTQLDQYMSSTRSYLDKQIDQYMAQPATTA